MSEEDSVPRQLRQAREARNQTLEEVYQECGLSVNVLQNLESGNFGVVEPVFVRLALASYAGYLGLDADSIVAEYDSAAGPPRQPPPPPPPPRPAPSAVSQLSPRVRLIGLGVGAGLVVLVLLLLALGDDEPEPQPPVPLRPPPASANRPARPQERRAEPAATPSRPQASRTEPAEAPDAPQARPAEPKPAAELQSAAAPETEPAPPAAASESTAPSGRAAPAAELLDEAPESTALAEARPPETAPEPADGARAEPAAPAHTRPPESAPAEPPAAGTAAVPVIAAETPSSEASPATAIDSLLVLEAEAVDSVWVQIKWDDANVFERLVLPGFRRTWQARSHFLVRSGRPHGMRYWFQGQLLGDRGRLGDPYKTLRFKASREGVDLLDSGGNPLVPRAPATSPPDRPR